jgi:hypothetical protein
LRARDGSVQASFLRIRVCLDQEEDFYGFIVPSGSPLTADRASRACSWLINKGRAFFLSDISAVFQGTIRFLVSSCVPIVVKKSFCY